MLGHVEAAALLERQGEGPPGLGAARERLGGAAADAHLAARGLAVIKPHVSRPPTSGRRVATPTQKARPALAGNVTLFPWLLGPGIPFPGRLDPPSGAPSFPPSELESRLRPPPGAPRSGKGGTQMARG